MPDNRLPTRVKPDFPILILSLEGDERRRAPLLQKLDDLGLEYQVFHGVDGRKGLPPEYESKVDRVAAQKNNRRFLGDSELAASLSHHEIYRHIVENGLPGAIILEDDAILLDAFEGFVKRGEYRPYDMALLDHEEARVLRKPVMKADGYLVYRLFNHQMWQFTYRATGYSLSQKGAQYMLSVTTPVQDVPDWPGDITTIGAVALHPHVVDRPDPLTGVSHLRDDRDASFAAGLEPPEAIRKRRLRFFSAAYWRRWWLKRGYPRPWIKIS